MRGCSEGLCDGQFFRECRWLVGLLGACDGSFWAIAVTRQRPVVVTGGAWFIGSHIVDRLLADGMTVRVIDDLSTGSRGNLSPTVELDEFDLASDGSANRLARLRPAVVIHCAAQASVASSVSDPAADAERTSSEA